MGVLATVTCGIDSIGVEGAWIETPTGLAIGDGDSVVATIGACAEATCATATGDDTTYCCGVNPTCGEATNCWEGTEDGCITTTWCSRSCWGGMEDGCTTTTCGSRSC